MKLHKGDEVVVIAGKDKGRRGTISRVIPEKNRVIVDGINVVKKHQRATQTVRQAGIIDREMPIHISNVAAVSPGDGNATRVGYRVDDEGNKYRTCKRTGSDL